MPVIARVKPGVFFAAPAQLPRGPHTLAREEVLAAQRERLMAALTEVMAARGYHRVSIGEVATRSGVSRSAFYECFDGKDACAFAAYDRFIDVLLTTLAERVAMPVDLDDRIVALLEGYLGTLQHDLVVARAFLVEVDAVGLEARDRRRDALRRIAGLLRADHERRQADDPALGPPLPEEAYLGAVYAARQLASDALDEEHEPDLLALAPKLAAFLANSFRGPAG
jgi:AcrR family transcriptional regulator